MLRSTRLMGWQHIARGSRIYIESFVDHIVKMDSFLSGKLNITNLFVRYMADIKNRDERDLQSHYVSTRKESLDIIKSVLLQDFGLLEFLDANELLRFAVEDGYEELVEILLNKGASSNSASKAGETPLLIAADKGWIKIVNLLLNHGALVNSCSDTSPLLLAYKNGHNDVCELLFNSGAEINIKHVSGKAILNLAIERGDSAVIDEALNPGLDVKNRSERKIFSVLCFSEEKYANVTHKLLQCAFCDNETISVLMQVAIAKVYLTVIEQLLKHGIDVNTISIVVQCQQYTPLQYAVFNNTIEVVKLLMNYGAYVNVADKYGRTALLFSGVIDHVKCNDQINADIAELLLKNGACIDARTKSWKTTLHYAVEMGKFLIIDILMKYGADIDCKDGFYDTPLHIACRKEFMDIIYTLLKHNANVNSENIIQETPLHIACQKKSVNMINALVNYNADVNCIDKHKETPLHIACRDGSSNVVNVLLKNKADVNCKDRLNNTPLHSACISGNINIIEALLKCNSNVNSKNSQDYTPLHLAALYDNLAAVKSLLDFGGRTDCKSKNGDTALHIACQGKDHEIVLYLLEYGCDINIGNARHVIPHDLLLSMFAVNHDLNTLRVLNIVQKHSVKLKLMHQFMKDASLSSVNGQYEGLELEYVNEILLMKSTKLGDSLISIYDLISKNANYVANILNNENIQQNVQQIVRSDIYRKFPHFAGIIKSSLRKGEIRKNLLEEVDKVCYKMFRGLSFDCIQSVLTYLSIQDLRMMIAACQSSSSYEL